MVNCYKCNTDLQLSSNEKVGLKDTCEKCMADIHCCKMCNFYDVSSYNECRESSAERIVDKEKANYCDYFVLGSGTNNEDAAQSALDAANALFKD